jgi:hypothetical protein
VDTSKRALALSQEVWISFQLQLELFAQQASIIPILCTRYFKEHEKNV